MSTRGNKYENLLRRIKYEICCWSIVFFGFLVNPHRMLILFCWLLSWIGEKAESVGDMIEDKTPLFFGDMVDKMVKKVELKYGRRYKSEE